MNKITKETTDSIYFLMRFPKGEFREGCISKEDLHLLKHTWSGSISKSNYVGKVRCTIKNKQYFLSRLILNITDSKESVDHINGNTLDNCRSNLRICSQKDNMKNQKLNNTSTTGYKGVSTFKHCSKYRAYIVLDYKQIHLGLYINPEDAARAYNAAAVLYHGRFARLNVLRSKEQKEAA